MRFLTNPERKVLTATGGAAGGSVFAVFALWLLGVFVWDAPRSADAATQAVEAVPGPVSGVVYFVIPVLTTYLAGWVARHTPRPELAEEQGLSDLAPGDSG